MYISYKISYCDQLTKKNITKLARQIQNKALKDQIIKKSICTKNKHENKKIFRKSLRLLIGNLIYALKLKQQLVISLHQNILQQHGLCHRIYVQAINILIRYGYIHAEKGCKNKRTVLYITESFKDYIIDNIFSMIVADKNGYIDAILTDIRTMNGCKKDEYIRASWAIHNQYYYQNILLDYTEQGLKDLSFWSKNRKKYIIGTKAKIKIEKTNVVKVKFD